jgi:anti-sigma regulatory factor (Ser/Thr protein kinase)
MNRLSRQFPARPSSVPKARGAARAWAQALGADAETLEALALAVTEAVANAAVHAYRGRDAGAVELHLEETPDGLVVSVTDHGVGMGPRSDSPGLGLGMPLITRMADCVEVSHGAQGGTKVRMRFSR